MLTELALLLLSVLVVALLLGLCFALLLLNCLGVLLLGGALLNARRPLKSVKLKLKFLYPRRGVAL